MWISHSAGCHCFLNGSMGGVESTIEADHERYAVFANCTQSLVNLADVQADRLLAKDRLAGGRRPGDQLDVRVSTTADGHGIDGVGFQNLIDGHHRCAQRISDLRCGGIVDIEHGGHLGAVGFIRDDVRMHSADATDTQHTYTHRHKNS